MNERFTVAGVLRTNAAERPDAPMFVAGDERRSWAAQYERSTQVARALLAAGIGAGDRVAVLDRNGLAHFDVLFGGSFIGAVNVALNWRLAPGEMAAIIDDARARILFVHAEYLECLDRMDGGPEGLEAVVVIGDPGPPAAGDRTATGDRTGAGDRRRVAYEHWLSGHGGPDPGHVPVPEEAVVQLYTSGTTGLPKGVMLSNANLSTAIAQAGSTFRIDTDTVSLVAMPLFHIGGVGWALCGMSRGGTSIVLRDVDPVELLALIGREHVTETFVVPAVLMFLLATPEIAGSDLSSLRNVFYGASPIAEDVLVRCLEVFGCSFTQVYGMTETTGAICALPPEDHDPDGPRRRLLRSAGRAHPGVELRIVDPDTGADVPTGTVGEVCTRSGYTMLGYWGKAAETAAALSPDGWLRTGDAGYLDQEGYLFLHDRIKDMIVTGGENVYPAEIENVVHSHPAVADVAVIGVPDDRWGETIRAVVVLAPGPGGETLTGEALIEHCRERLAHYKCPTSVEMVDQLPRNPSGKVLKRELRRRHWEGEHRRIH